MSTNPETWQFQRQSRFQYLVRRYISQIKYGCDNETCTTPTCRSYIRNSSTKPVKAPTVLTARALAFLLAAEKDPERCLCPHTLVYDPDALPEEIAGTVDKVDDKSLTQQVFDSPSVRAFILRQSIVPHGSPYVPRPLRCADLEELKSRLWPLWRGMSLPPHDLDEVLRALFTSLSDYETLLRSFQFPGPGLIRAFRHWHQLCGPLVFDSLWIAAGAIYTRPPDLPRSPKSLSDRPASRPTRFLNNKEAAHIAIICIHALTSSIGAPPVEVWSLLRHSRSQGNFLPGKGVDEGLYIWLQITDQLEYEPAVRLTERLLCGIRARECFDIIRGTEERETFMTLLVEYLLHIDHHVPSQGGALDPNARWSVLSALVERLRTVIIKEWDGKPIVSKNSSVGAAIMMMDRIGFHTRASQSPGDPLAMPYLKKRLHPLNDPVQFLQHVPTKNYLHLFEYPWLFPTNFLKQCFRAINFSSLVESYRKTDALLALRKRLEDYDIDIFDRLNQLGIDLHEQGVLTARLAHRVEFSVTRENVTENAVAVLMGLWADGKDLLRKPIAFKIGQEEGELGQDLGGVAYEVFQQLVRDLMDNYGCFTNIGAQGELDWFEVRRENYAKASRDLGIFISLAVHSGITLPVNFPYTLYQYLLQPTAPSLGEEGATRGTNVKDLIDSIRDGWPQEARSLDEIANANESQISNLTLEYVFTFGIYDNLGIPEIHEVDMTRFNRDKENWEVIISLPDVLDTEPWCLTSLTRNLNKIRESDPESSELDHKTVPVTIANRDDFIRDKIAWMTRHSVTPWIQAFRQGFYEFLDEKAVRLFSPSQLKAVIEGESMVDVAKLREATTYDRLYTTDSQTILDFWAVLEEYSQEERRAFLKFVTACERAPAGGYRAIGLTIQYMPPSATGAARLPTASTCFRQLWLPDYENRELLREKLGLAIREGGRFGLA